MKIRCKGESTRLIIMLSAPIGPGCAGHNH
jgi:hypothetical protein